MLSGPTRLEVNGHEVAAKVMDGEAILINLSTGIYYGITGSGALIWSMIEAGYSLEEMIATIAERFGVYGETVADDVRRTVADLLNEALVVSTDSPTRKADVEPDTEAERAGYVAPKIHKYDDMAEIFALDPPLPKLPETAGRDD